MGSLLAAHEGACKLPARWPGQHAAAVV